MKKMLKRKFNDSGIGVKILLVYIVFASLFFAIALALLQISFYIYSGELYEKSVQELDYFSQNVNRDLAEAESSNYSMAMDTYVQQTLREMSKAEYPSVEYNQFTYMLRNQLLNEYSPESCVRTIIYIDLYGNKSEVGTASWEIPDNAIEKIKTSMYDANGAYVTYEPTEECPYMLTGRIVRNRIDMSLNQMGYLIYVCDVRGVIRQNKQRLESQNATVHVYSGDNTIYKDENAKEIKGITSYQDKSGYKIMTEDGKKYFVSYLYADETGWMYVDYFPYSDIYGQVQTMRTLLFIGFLVVFLALVWCMKRISFVVTEPLKHLTQSIQIVEDGDFSAAMEVITITDRKDEIGILSREFYTMLQTVEHLIKENYEKQILIKDTKYKMLRAQINPHFLYNTLNVIHWTIKAGGNDEAGKMIVNLGAILHYSFSRETYATVTDEMEMVKCYINIQKTRYQKRIRFQIEEEGKLDNYVMPRMIIQPLVENAINYGAEPYQDVCDIIIKVTELENDIRIMVGDTGAGMDKDELEAVRNMDFKPKGHGIGLQNIEERLKLDDKNSIFKIDSEIGKGTTVIIEIHKKMRGGRKCIN